MSTVLAIHLIDTSNIVNISHRFPRIASRSPVVEDLKTKSQADLEALKVGKLDAQVLY